MLPFMILGKMGGLVAYTLLLRPTQPFTHILILYVWIFKDQYVTM